MSVAEFRLLCVVVIAALLTTFGLVGCGSSSSPKKNGAKSSASKTSKSKKNDEALPPPPPPKPAVVVPQDAFASVPVALGSLTSALSANDSDAFQKAEAWLVMNKESSASYFAEVLNKSDTKAETQIAICRVFPKLGSAAASPMIAAIKSPTSNVRLKAIEGLSLIKPSSAQIVSALQGAMKGTDLQTRRQAIEGLTRIGPPAKAVVPDLLAILNNDKEDETLRSFAKQALKKIDERRGLMGVAEKADSKSSKGSGK